MAHFFSQLLRQTSFRRQSSTTSSGACHEFLESDLSLNIDTREDEGFVLIGQTLSERNSEVAPLSEMSFSELPSYGQAMTSQCASQQSSFSGFNPTDQPSSPISGVPFKLHPTLDCDSQIKEIFFGINLEIKQFNWSKYSHDFSNEKLVLRDLSCGEEANIDEFISSNIGIDSLPRNSSDTVGNLIDL